MAEVNLSLKFQESNTTPLDNIIAKVDKLDSKLSSKMKIELDIESFKSNIEYVKKSLSGSDIGKGFVNALDSISKSLSSINTSKMDTQKIESLMSVLKGINSGDLSKAVNELNVLLGVLKNFNSIKTPNTQSFMKGLEKIAKNDINIDRIERFMEQINHLKAINIQIGGVEDLQKLFRTLTSFKTSDIDSNIVLKLQKITSALNKLKSDFSMQGLDDIKSLTSRLRSLDNLKIDEKKFVDKMTSIRKGFEELSKAKIDVAKVQTMAESLQALKGLDTVGRNKGISTNDLAFGLGGLVSMSYAKNVINNAKDLEYSVLQVGVAGGLTKLEIEDLKSSMYDMGRMSGKSALELSASMETIIKTGQTLKVSKFILDASVKASIATGDDLGATAEALSKSMLVMGINASRATDIINSMMTVANNTPASMDTIRESMRQAGAGFENFVSTTSKTGAVLDDYKMKLINTELALVGGQAKISRLGGQSGTSIRTLMTRLTTMEKTAENLFNNDMKVNNVFVKMNESTGKLAITTEKTNDAFAMTSTMLSNIAQEDAPQAIELLSQMEVKGLIGMRTMNKLFTQYHASYLKSGLRDINGDLDEYIKKSTQGTTVTEGFGLVSSSWANEMDKAKESFNAFTQGFVNSIGKNGLLGFTMQAINGISAISSHIKQTSDAGSIGLAVFSNAISIFALSSIVNLNKVSSAFSALGNSAKALAVNPYMLAILALTSAITIANTAFQNYIENLERSAEESIKNADSLYKSLEAIKEAKKEYKALNEELVKLGGLDTVKKWTSINDAFMRASETFSTFKEGLEAINNLNAKLTLNIDYKRYAEESNNILTRKVTFKYNANAIDELSQKRNAEAMLKMNSGDRNVDYTGIEGIKKQASEEFNIKKNNFAKIQSEWVRMEAQRRVLEESGDLKNAKIVGKNAKEKYNEMKNLKIELNKDFGVNIVDLSTQVNDNLADYLKNINAVKQAEQERLQLIEDTLDDLDEAISKQKVVFAKDFISKTTISNLKEFNDVLSKFDLGEYSGMINKDFKGVLDAIPSQSGKVEYIKNTLMGVIQTQQVFNKAIEDSKKSFAEMSVKISNYSGKTFGVMYQQYQKQGKSYLNTLSESDKATLISMGRWKSVIPQFENLKKQNIENAKIQEKQNIEVKKYNDKMDEQLIALRKINATKLQQLGLDRELAGIKNKDVVTEEKGYMKTNINEIKKEYSSSVTLNNNNMQIKKNQGLDSLGNILGYNKINLEDVNSMQDVYNKLLNAQSDMKNATLPEQALVNKLLDIYTSLKNIKSAQLQYSIDNLGITKSEYDVRNEIFSNYMDYMNLGNSEIETLKYKKKLLEDARNLTDDNYEKIRISTDILKAQYEIDNKILENKQRIKNIEYETQKYELDKKNLYEDSVSTLKSVYDYNKNLLDIDNERLKTQKSLMENNFVDKSGISNYINTLKSEQNGINLSESGITDEEKKQREKRSLELSSQIAELENLSAMTEEQRNEALKNNVKYKEILKDLAKNGLDLSNLDLKYTKDKLNLTYQLLELEYQRQDIQNEMDRERSRNIYKEVFGDNSYNPNISKENIKKSKDDYLLAKNKVFDYRKLMIEGNKSYDFTKDAEYLKLRNELDQKDLDYTKTLNEEEIKRIQHLKEVAEVYTNIIDSLSKGEAIKFDTSKAIGGGVESFVKLFDGKALNKGDYGKLAMAGAGVATNIINQAFQSQMNVVNAEMQNLEMRKQLARTEKEKQEIDKEQLDYQKQLIDLQYAQSTQTMGVTGVAGSALGGAMSGATTGAMMGMKSGNPLFAAIGGGIGLIGGLFGGSSAKKQAEQQKKQLEAQYRTNIYLEQMRALMEANNKLLETVYSNSSKGFNQAMKNAFKEFYQTQNEKGLFNLQTSAIGQYSTYEGYNTSKFLYDKFGLDASNLFKNTNWEEARKPVVDYITNSFNDIQSKISSLTYKSTEDEVKKTQEQIIKLKDQLTNSLSNNADELLVKQLEDWENYIKTLELIGSKKDVFYSAYFGFDTQYIKDEAGYITNVLIGEWQKRTEFLDTMVSDAMSQQNSIGIYTGKYFIESFANVFTRNKPEIEAILNNMESSIQDFAKGMANGSFQVDNVLNGLKLIAENKQTAYYEFIKNSTDGNIDWNIRAIQDLVSSEKQLTEQQKEVNSEVLNFAKAWVLAGGEIETLLDMLPEYSKTLQKAMQDSLSVTDFQERFNNMGNALKSTIEDHYNKISFEGMITNFMTANDTLTKIMTGNTASIDDMLSLSQQLQKYSAQSEQQAYKTKAMIDLLSLDTNVDYGVSNTQTEYKTGSTSTNVYNFNNNINTQIGNFLGDAKAIKQFSNQILGTLIDVFQENGFDIKKK